MLLILSVPILLPPPLLCGAINGVPGGLTPGPLARLKRVWLLLLGNTPEFLLPAA
jgi:hypothetical protein